MNTLRIHHLGSVDYATAFGLQKKLTETRDAATPDELWCLEHPAVYTLGLAGRTEHVIAPGLIPVVKTDRGGQVTYHGPGQLVIYPLLDLKRKLMPIRRYIFLLEQAVIGMLDELGIKAVRRDKAPGVYVEGAKIAALGVRVRRGCCYHGLALNVDMDLAPFKGINPCGYPGLEVTQLSNLGIRMSAAEAGLRLIPHIVKELGFDDILVHAPGVDNEAYNFRHEVA